MYLFYVDSYVQHCLSFLKDTWITVYGSKINKCDTFFPQKRYIDNAFIIVALLLKKYRGYVFMFMHSMWKLLNFKIYEMHTNYSS